jgi:hypothetical protein
LSKQIKKFNPKQIDIKKFVKTNEKIKDAVGSKRPDDFLGLREELETYNADFRNTTLTFSFRHFEKTDVFNVNRACEGWTHLLMDTLTDLSAKTMRDLVEQQSRFRSHLINWPDVAYRFNDWSENQLEQYECRSISLGTSSGRVHGFHVFGVFYIVWLDPHHWLYPDDRYGKVRPTKPTETCCEAHIAKIKQFEQLIEESKKQIKELVEQNEMIYEMLGEAIEGN